MKVAGFHFLILGCVLAAAPAAANTQPALAKEGAVIRSQVRTKHGSHEIVAEMYAAPDATKTVVMIPSYARGPEDFTPVFGSDLAPRVAAAGYRVLLPRPRNFKEGVTTGESEGVLLDDLAADVEALVAEHGTTPAIFLGHAFGQRVIRTIATRSPAKVDRLILLAAGGLKPSPKPPHDALVGLTFIPDADDEQRDTWLMTAFFAPGNDPTIWRDGWSAGAGIPQAHANQDTPFEKWWAGGTAPMYVVQAAQDTIAPAAASSEPLKKSFPERVKIITIDNAGHAMLPEQPKAVGDAVLEFLSR
jgi:pimeloyl-ACP methyl ester carboxylesterase